jgi:hypothetical protein
VLLQEAIQLGQRVESFRLLAWDASRSAWSEIARGTTIGRTRMLRFPTLAVSKVRLEIARSRAVPAIATIGLYRMPPKLSIATTRRRFLKELDVALECDDPFARVFYTLDGSTPTDSSPRYEHPIHLTESCTLAAVAIAGAQSGAKSIVVRTDFEKLDERDLVPAILFIRAPDPGLAQTLYFDSEVALVGDIGSLAPSQRGVARTFGLPAGDRHAKLAMRLEGFLAAPRDDVYEFELSSDDGSHLVIDGRTVVDSDGLHGARAERGSIGLRSGWHRIEVLYFDAGGDRRLDIEWRAGDGDFAPIPENALAH